MECFKALANGKFSAKWGHLITRKVLEIFQKFFLQIVEDGFAVQREFFGIFWGIGEDVRDVSWMTVWGIRRSEKSHFLSKIIEIF